MPNPLFPGAVPLIGMEMPDTFQTYRSGNDCQNIVVVRKWDTPKVRGGKLKFRVNTSMLEQLLAFWASVQGGADQFDYVYPLPDVWHNLYVGIGDGSTRAFDLPGLSTSSRAMYKDGVAGTPTYTAGAGANGRDRGTFITAPVDGALVTCDFTGNRVIIARMGDEMNVTERGDGVYDVTVTIDEV